MKKGKYIIIYMTVAIVASVLPLKAQSDAAGTPTALDRMRMNSLWMRSRNAAGSFLDNPYQYATISSGYEWLSGDFHMPQQGEKRSGLNIFSDGAAILNNLYAWGKFSYKRDIMKDALYNSSIIDPYRGMPYYMLDDVSSEWRLEDYDLSFRVASRKFWNFLHIGLEGTYRSMMGAKQMDYRTANKSVFIELRPGIVMNAGQGHAIGLNFEYFNYKEEAAMERNDASSTLKDYEHFGLGMGLERTTVRQINYSGNSFGGSAQYHYTSGSCVNLLLEGSYRCKVEDVNYSWTEPTRPTVVKDRIWEAKAMSYFTSGMFTNHITIGGSDRNIDGIEYLIRDASANEPAKEIASNIRSTYHIQDLSFGYKLIRDRKREYKWMTEVGARYSKTEDEYLLPKSTMMYENVTFNLGVKVNFMLPKELQKRILLEGMFWYNHNLDGEYDFGGYYPNYPTVTMQKANLAYLTSDYRAFSLSLTYSRKLKEDRRMNLYCKAAFGMTMANDSGFEKRQSFSFSVGYNF